MRLSRALGLVVLVSCAVAPSGDERPARTSASPLVWSFQTKLARVDSSDGDAMGSFVAAAGDGIAIGGKDTTTIQRRRGALAWPEEQRLAVGGSRGAFDGNTLLVGTDDGVTAFATSEQGFVAKDGFAASWPKHAGGEAVVVQTNLAAIALAEGTTDRPAEPVVLVYERHGGLWASPIRVEIPGIVRDPEGLSLALDGPTLAVGTGSDVFVFGRRADGAWQLEADLTHEIAPDGTPSFGRALALSGDALLAGEPSQEVAVWAYRRTNGVWSLETKLTDGYSFATTDSFGATVTIYGEHAFIANPTAAGGGAVYRYRHVDAWALEERLTPPDGAKDGRFGSALAVTPDVAVIGDDTQRSGRGAVYVYAYRSRTGDACSANEACATGFCVDGVCCESACGGGTNEDCLTCAAPDAAGSCIVAPKGTSCREANGPCDVGESCDGSGVQCPADIHAVNGSACANGSCFAGACVAPAPSDAGPDAAPEQGAPAPAGSGCSVSIAPPGSASPVFVVLALIGSRWGSRRRRSRPFATRTR